MELNIVLPLYSIPYKSIFLEFQVNLLLRGLNESYFTPSNLILGPKITCLFQRNFISSFLSIPSHRSRRSCSSRSTFYFGLIERYFASWRPISAGWVQDSSLFWASLSVKTRKGKGWSIRGQRVLRRCWEGRRLCGSVGGSRK